MIEWSRIGIDKVFLSIYDKLYSTLGHTFDKNTFMKYFSNKNRVKIGSGRFEDVLSFKMETGGSMDLRLRASRGALVRDNVIEVLKQKYNFKIDESLKLFDDNFLPLDAQIPFIEHITQLRGMIKYYKRNYILLMKEFWNFDCNHIRCSMKSVEVPVEYFPASVKEIGDFLEDCGDLKITRYHNKTKTIYINSRKKSTKYQIKIYQKAPQLARLEFTFHNDLARSLFNFDLKTDETIKEDVELFIESKLKEYHLDRETLQKLDYSNCIDYFSELAILFNESNNTLFKLKDNKIFTALDINLDYATIKRLKRKKLIYAFERGLYTVNPFVYALLNRLDKMLEGVKIPKLRSESVAFQELGLLSNTIIES